MADTLRSGWITTGPKVKQLEEALATYVGVQNVLCLNSATAGLELMLRWFGVGEGDEVIVPSYTYCATANVVLHCGAQPVLVDVGRDFNISVKAIQKAITPKTKVIIPVDIAGYPCDYEAIHTLVGQEAFKQKFTPATEEQQRLGRILILSDAAHSLGAVYKGKKTGSVADLTVFSFHAVKNLTTAEGGAVCLNLPEVFDQFELYNRLRTKSLHGQTKDAFSKVNNKGSWEYDVVEAGYKYNMPDVLAAMGLVELKYYEKATLVKRKAIFDRYTQNLHQYAWAEIPEYENQDKRSSYHVYPLRIKGIDEQQRNRIIELATEEGVALNVHFKPLPLLSLYANLGYNIADFPVAHDNYRREITLPVYFDLDLEQVDMVTEVLANAYKQVC